MTSPSSCAGRKTACGKTTMKRFMHRSALAALLLAASPSAAQSPSSVEGFYKDKKVRMLVGYGVGTGNDLYMRLLARHIGKHIPGRPTIVPENMPGAGSMVMMNYLYNVAPRDGTAIGVPSRNLAVEPLLGNEQARYEALKFGWLGSMSRDVSTCVSWHTSGINTVGDATRREVPVGATGAPADSNIFPKLLNAALSTRFKIVLGYPDSAAVGIAMERREIDGYCSFTWSAIKSARPQWVAEKQINVLLQLSLSKHPELPDVPLVMDLAKDEASRQMFALAFGTQKMGRPAAAPPGIPADRADALRQAFNATMVDPEFLEDARRSVLEVDGPISGKEVDAILKQIYATPIDLIAKFEAIRSEK
jgi:tripartite-type tricarboxylate transporter receptor subunit TctC